MAQNTRTNALVLLHFVVLLFGFTGILGKLITIEAIDLVFYRMAIAAVSLFVFCALTKRLKMKKKHIFYLLGIGAVVALHWVTFFAAIKITNVSLALACLSSASFFTAILEPIILRSKWQKFDLMLGILVVAGVLMMFKVEAGSVWGIVVALISALLAALFTVLNGKAFRYGPPSTVSLIEMIGGFVCLLVFVLWDKGVLPNIPSNMDIFWLLILGIFCTAFAFVASVRVMEHLSPFTVALSVNLEPIYAIILAFIIFNEHQDLGINFYVGASLIFLSVFAKPAWNFILKKRTKAIL